MDSNPVCIQLAFQPIDQHMFLLKPTGLLYLDRLVPLIEGQTLCERCVMSSTFKESSVKYVLTYLTEIICCLD